MLGCSLALCVGASVALAPAGGAHAAHAQPDGPTRRDQCASRRAGALSVADRSVALAHALHAAVIRTEVPWSLMEPARANRPAHEAYADRLVNDAAAEGCA